MTAPNPESLLRATVERACARVERVDAAAVQPELRARLAQLAIASDFAIETLVRQPGLLAALDAPAQPAPELQPGADADWPGQLRRWRAAESTRLVWRDLAGMDSVEDTLAGSTRIAEQALGCALAAVEGAVRERHGAMADGR